MPARELRIPLAIAALALVGALAAAIASGQTETELSQGDTSDPPSIAAGKPWDGRLWFGVRLARESEDFFTWDFALRQVPNRPWRRWGADGTVRILRRVLRRFALAHPEAPRIGVADLSRRHGGPFGPRFGGLGHASHQNGLDVDVIYPRRDRREWRPKRPAQIDRALAQDLVRRFVRAGAEFVFVGPRTGLTGPPSVVQELTHHDDHMHVRFPRRLGAPG
jgi:murein endopeptidase